jgi:hypothetical protein
VEVEEVELAVVEERTREVKAPKMEEMARGNIVDQEVVVGCAVVRHKVVEVGGKGRQHIHCEKICQARIVEFSVIIRIYI